LKVALFSKAFLPNVGGIETSSAMIARTWQAAGHEVRVVTAVPDDAPPSEPYPVVRRWSLPTLIQDLADADVAVTNGYSRAVVVAAAARRLPLIVFHQGYQLICSDGLGFRDRQFHHFETMADLKLAFAAGAGTGARAIARLPFDAAVQRWPFGVTHVVPSHHVGRRLVLPAFKVIYQPPNPAVIEAVAPLGPPTDAQRAIAYQEGDIVFFGRLVFEKGCDDLIHAYAKLRAGGATAFRRALPRLVIYGRGPILPEAEQLASDLGIAAHVSFRPFLSGHELAEAARAASVVVMPSRWEEPGATLAVELFACGAAVIASRLGAQGEIFESHGRLFPNGDADALATVLATHFREGPIYPRWDEAAPWSVASIRRDLLALLVP
jgi:glycogen synthase